MRVSNVGKRLGSWWVVAMAATLAIAGCNAVTGADSLVVGHGQSDDDDGNNSAGGNGAATSGSSTPASSGAGTTSSGVGGQGAAPPEAAYADGVALTDVDLYQGIRRPLVDGAALASSNIPIVAGKDAMVRVFYTIDGNYNGQPVTARFTVGNHPPVEQTATLNGTSSQQQMSSTINLQVPGDILTTGANFKVELLQPSEITSGDNDGAAFPADGSSAALAVQQGGVTLKIVLVPVMNNGSLPNTSGAQVQAYQTLFAEEYPVANVNISVRSQPHTYNGNLGSYNGWANLLDEITTLKNQDGVAPDVYYYGIHNANGNGLLGLGWVAGPNDVFGRTAIGVGWGGSTATETAVHEVGHNHGRSHSPCGTSGDAAYPHSGASIGVWGYSPSQNKLLNPTNYKDFMSYCQPQWISDWTFQALFNRLKLVSTSPSIYTPPFLKNRTYDRIRIIEDEISWRAPVVLATPPMGEAMDVIITTGRNGTEVVNGHYYPYNHIDGGLLYVMRPLQWSGPLDNVLQLTVQAEDQQFQLGPQP